MSSKRSLKQISGATNSFFEDSDEDSDVSTIEDSVDEKEQQSSEEFEAPPKKKIKVEVQEEEEEDGDEDDDEEEEEEEEDSKEEVDEIDELMTSCTLCLNGISSNMHEINVKNLFPENAIPISIEMRTQTKSGEYLKRAFVKFEDKSSAKLAFEHLLISKESADSSTILMGDKSVKFSVAARDAKQVFSSNRLVISGLPYADTNNKRLLKFCNPKPLKVQLYKHRTNNEIPTQAILTFNDESNSAECMELFKNKKYKGHELWVKYVQEAEDVTIKKEFEDDTYLVSIENVSWKVSSNDLYEFFKNCGQIACVKVFRNINGVNQGRAEVLFETYTGVSNAVLKNESESTLKGVQVKVSAVTDSKYIPFLQTMGIALDKPQVVYRVEKKFNKNVGYSDRGSSRGRSRGRGSRGRGRGRGSRGRGRGRGRGGYGGSEVTCYSCGESGHMSRECPNKADGGGNSNVTCYSCGESGHMSRECPNKSGGGGSSVTCYSCGESGHMSRECPTKGDGRGNSSVTCYSCGESGHMSRECPNKKTDFTCYSCGESGHMSRECPNKSGSSGGYGGQRSCYSCGETGHISRDCPSAESGGGWKSSRGRGSRGRGRGRGRGGGFKRRY